MNYAVDEARLLLGGGACAAAQHFKRTYSAGVVAVETEFLEAILQVLGLGWAVWEESFCASRTDLPVARG